MTKRPTVMVVEDDEIVGPLLQRLLTQAGYRPTLARDGAAALEMLRAHRRAPRALIVDVLLPGWRGDIVATRAREAYPDLPIVFMSGYLTEPVTGPLPHGCTFLAKPFTPDELLRALAEILPPPQ